VIKRYVNNNLTMCKRHIYGKGEKHGLRYGCLTFYKTIAMMFTRMGKDMNNHK